MLDRAVALSELAAHLVDELERRDRDYLEHGGLVRVKLLVVDAGGDRRIVTLEPPDWTVEPRVDPGGELIFLQVLRLIGVERVQMDREMDSNP
jgi:hypothetical protein